MAEILGYAPFTKNKMANYLLTKIIKSYSLIVIQEARNEKG